MFRFDLAPELRFHNPGVISGQGPANGRTCSGRTLRLSLSARPSPSMMVADERCMVKLPMACRVRPCRS
jgi:hypothetical protein